MALPGSLVPVNTDFCSILLAGLTQPAEKQTHWGRTWLSQKPGFWLLEVRQKVFIRFFGGVGVGLEVIFLRGKVLWGRPFFPGLKKGHCAYGTHQVWRRKNRELMLARMSTPAKTAKPPLLYCFCCFIFTVSTYHSLIHSTVHVSFVYCLSHVSESKTFELLVYLDFVFAKTSTPKDRDGKKALKS